MGRRATAKQWQARVEAWKRSGETAAQFAATRGLKAQQLRWWSWKLSKAQAGDQEAGGTELAAPRPQVTFLPVHVSTDSSTQQHGSNAPVEVMAGGGVVVRVGAGCDARWVATLVRALQAPEGERC